MWHQVWHLVWHTPPAGGGRSRPYVSLREGSPARARAGRSATPSGPIRDALLRAFLVIGNISAACAWTWPGVFPEGDPVAVLVRYHTPNVYAAVVVWYYVAPGVAMFIAGQFLISTSRIWFARMGGSLGLRSHLPAWPLKREQRMTDTEDRLRRTMEGIIQKFQSAPPHGGRPARRATSRPWR